MFADDPTLVRGSGIPLTATQVSAYQRRVSPSDRSWCISISGHLDDRSV